MVTCIESFPCNWGGVLQASHLLLKGCEKSVDLELEIEMDDQTCSFLLEIPEEALFRSLL